MTKIFIDPGHNPTGNDTGAVGYGLKEQDVTVEIALKLKPLLERNGFEVKMSRNSLKDTVAEGLNASLAGRYNAANSWDADIFVSIHCNSANTKAYGCETYYYTGSSKGRRLADCVQPELAKETGLCNRGVKSANFAVIKHTNMPAILVETAFIDNYDDNRFLANDDGKYKCAVGIYKGICNYFGVEYKLESGDELLSSEYEELKKKDESQDKVIDAIGADILNNTKEIDYIKAQLATYDYIDENMPEWAVPTITKLVDKGLSLIHI